MELRNADQAMGRQSKALPAIAGHAMTGKEQRARRALLPLPPLILAALILLLLPLVARAHGIGTPQRLNVPSGPYWLSIWTDPDPLRADQTHIVVAVLEPETQEPIVTGVEVMVQLRSLADGTVRTQAAVTDNTNRLLYAAEFTDHVSPGRWEASVLVSGERGVGDPVTFEVEIGPARRVNWLWVGVGGLGAALVVWLLSAGRAGRRRVRGRPTLLIRGIPVAAR